MKNLNSTAIRIILIRHGETEWNKLRRFQGRSDIPLNPKGNKQASALALALKNEDITAMYTSPLTRAVETASHIRRFHPSIPLIEEPGLMEMDLGKFEGLDVQQWALQHPEFREIWEEKPASLTLPGGESLQDVQHRAVETLNWISDLYEFGSTVLICSHNFVIVSLLCFASNIHLDQFREVKQGTAALNIMRKNGDEFQIEKINDRNHLQKIE